MIDFDKRLKGGLKKCSLHKFGANYTWVKDYWYECDKCKAFHEINLLTKFIPKKLNIKSDRWGIGYTDIS